MGWLYMQSLKAHSGPRQYLDAQFTFDRPEISTRVLRSALVKMRVYYAAVEQLRAGEAREVSAIVCLVHYNPRDREGYIFGYKDIDEGMGPHESDCPEAILDLLTPTDRPYAVAWRARCRGNAEARRVLAEKPWPRPGQTVVFDEPLRFSDEFSLDQFEVVANPRSSRTILFRDPGRGGLYRIPNVKSRACEKGSAHPAEPFFRGGAESERRAGTGSSRAGSRERAVRLHRPPLSGSSPHDPDPCPGAGLRCLVPGFGGVGRA